MAVASTSPSGPWTHGAAAPDGAGVRFDEGQGDPFLADLRARVDHHFGTRSRKADGAQRLKGALLMGAWVLVYGAILTRACPTPVLLALAMGLGLLGALVGMNVVHDALHGAWSSRQWVNRALGFWFDLTGASSQLWMETHNRGHHTFTNIPGHDPDLAAPFLLRFSTATRRRPCHAWQYWYCWGLYALLMFEWVFHHDFVLLFRQPRRHRPGVIALALGLKAMHLTVYLVVPALVLPLPWWQVAVGYVVLQATTGLFLSTLFQLAHLVEGPTFPRADEHGRVPTSWSLHQLATTSDFSRDSAWLAFLAGGLNFQVEHHLFPRVAHCHYRDLAVLVREAAEAAGRPCHDQPTLLSALRSHLRLLSRLGRS